MSHRRRVAAITGVVLVLFASGCAQRYTAERDGKKLGLAVCDVRNATTAADANAAKADALQQLDDLDNKWALATAEDRKDVQNNLADLAEHTIQGNTLLRQQDLAVLQRSISHIADDSDDVARAAWEGVLEGLSTCTP
jgi:hypothetical protein